MSAEIIAPPRRSYYATTPREVLLAPQEGDASPASGFARLVMRVVIAEVDKICAQFDLPECDELDEERYERAMGGYLAMAARQWSPQTPTPCGAELRAIRSGIREFERWRRKPNEEELQAIVDKACGITRQSITGADEAARRVVSQPQVLGLPPVPDDLRGMPAWLPNLVAAVGDNELAISTFMVPLLNMTEGEARKAIARIAEGVRAAKERKEGAAQKARAQGRTARQSYVKRCQQEAIRLARAARHEEESAFDD